MSLFLKFESPEIKGESRRDGFEGQIDVLSWSWALEQPRLTARPNRSAASRPEFAGLTFEHMFDLASPKLMTHLATGEQIGKATLTATTTTTTDETSTVENISYLTVELKEVTVAAIDVSGDEERPIETITLNFTTVKLVYKTLDDEGKTKPGNEFKWNVKRNRSDDNP